MPPERGRPGGPSERILVQFDQALLQVGPQPGSLWLHGEERGTGVQRAQVFFSGIHSGVQSVAALPAQWQAVQVYERIEQGVRSWRICAGQETADVGARAVQVHREPVRAFYQALPSQAPSRPARLGWMILLALLRIPGAAPLLARLRSR